MLFRALLFNKSAASVLSKSDFKITLDFLKFFEKKLKKSHIIELEKLENEIFAQISLVKA